MLIYTSCRCDLGHNSLLHLPCWVMLGGLLLKSHCSGPLTELGPTCFLRTVHFTLTSSVYWACPMGSQHVSLEQVTTDMLAYNGKWHCASGSNERKMLKKWLFFHISSIRCVKSEYARTLFRKELLLPSPCQLVLGDSKRLLKQVNWK